MSGEQRQKDIIDELIEKIDDPVCGYKPLSKWKIARLGFANLLFIGLSFFYLGVLVYAIHLLFPLITKPEDLLPIVIALTAIILQLGIFGKTLSKFIEREEMIQATIDWNYERIREGVENEHWLLLKALILMKTLQKSFKLSEVRREYPSLFNEENLVGMLYNMSPISIGTHREKNTEGKAEAREENEKPNNNSLIAEYQVLNKVVNRRGSDTLLVDSIMIPSSLIVVLFAIEFKENLGTSILFNVPNAGFVPLLSLMLIIIPYILWCTSTKLDKICFDRMCDIEKELHIKGHQNIRERTRCEIWFKVRRNMWHVFFLLFIVTYIFTACWLFRETVIA